MTAAELRNEVVRQKSYWSRHLFPNGFYGIGVRQRRRDDFADWLGVGEGVTAFVAFAVVERETVH